MPKPCEYTPSDNHSKDRLTVWHGSTTPIVLCGYHYQNNLKGAFALKMKAS
jgi:hypothetical protein